MTYLDPLVSAERDLLRHFDMDRVTSGVLDNKAVGEGDAVGLGPAQQPATSVVYRRHRSDSDTNGLVRSKGRGELLIGGNIGHIRLKRKTKGLVKLLYHYTK